MASKRRKPNLLAARMRALDATDAEVAEIAGDVLVAEVVAWRTGEAPIDDAAAIALRPFMQSEHLARIALQRLRGKRTRDWRGDGMEYAGIDPEQIADRTPPIKTGGRPT